MSSSVNFTKGYYMRKIYVKRDRYQYCSVVFQFKSIGHDIKSKNIGRIVNFVAINNIDDSLAMTV